MARGYSYNQKPKKFGSSKFRRIKINLFSSFMFGVVRGIGMAVGFSGIAVVLLYIVRFLPLQNIPLIGDLIRAIIQSQR